MRTLSSTVLTESMESGSFDDEYMDGLIFSQAACAYPTLEMIWRGHTHYSMAIAGGICLYLIDKDLLRPPERPAVLGANAWQEQVL